MASQAEILIRAFLRMRRRRRHAGKRDTRRDCIGLTPWRQRLARRRGIYWSHQPFALHSELFLAHAVSRGVSRALFPVQLFASRTASRALTHLFSSLFRTHTIHTYTHASAVFWKPAWSLSSLGHLRRISIICAKLDGESYWSLRFRWYSTRPLRLSWAKFELIPINWRFGYIHNAL